MKTVDVLNGPNLNQLGQREPSLYGTQTLPDIENRLQTLASQHNIALHFFQTQYEGALVEAIHKAHASKRDFLIINAAAYTHTSIAIRDALICVTIPFIEVHMSNIYARESFRHISYLSDIAHGVITGFGAESYLLALQAIINIQEPQNLK